MISKILSAVKHVRNLKKFFDLITLVGDTLTFFHNEGIQRGLIEGKLIESGKKEIPFSVEKANVDAN